MPNFDIDNVRNNEFTKITMAFPDIGVVKTAFLVDDTFAIGTESGFEELYTGDMFQSVITAVAGDRIGNFISNVKGASEKLSGTLTKSVWQTVNAWTGSKRPSFNLSILLLKIRASDNVLTDSTFLMSRCLPDSDKSNSKIFTLNSLGANDFRLKAPNGYNPLDQKGMINVKIGKWFMATYQCLLSADFEISKEVTEDGNPLYATGKISFEPYRMITSSEFLDYFPTVRR